MKPVTELYERLEHWAATDIDDAEVFHSFQAGAAIQQLAKAAGMDTPRFLEVLDLVATLPPERIEALKEWLDEKPICPTCCNRGHVPGCEDASSGGEGMVKAVHFPEKCGARGPNTGGLCEARMMVPHREHYAPATNEMWPTGKTPEEPGSCLGLQRWVGGVDYGGGAAICGNCGVAQQDDAALRPCGARALEKEKPKPTMLPAGKPPPFLRVGMVLCVPGAPCGDIRIRGEEVDGRVQVSGIDGSTWLASVSRLRAEWVLAEPFTVEGES